MPEECSCHGLRVVATVFVLYFFYFSVVCYEWLFLASLAHFPRFCRQYFSLSNAFSIHLARKTYFLPCSGFFGIFFLTFLLLVCLQNLIPSSSAENHGHFLESVLLKQL